jgi:hypothetical protein
MTNRSRNAAVGTVKNIDGDQFLKMIIQKSPPGLGWGLAALGHQPRDGALRDLEPQFQ